MVLPFMNRHRLRSFVLALLLILLVGCSSPRANAVALATATAERAAARPRHPHPRADAPRADGDAAAQRHRCAEGDAYPAPPSTATPSVTPTPTLLARDLTATARPTAWPTPDHPLVQEERALLFDELWKTVSERYLDPAFNGVDWAALREPYRARALAAPNDEGYYQVLKEMVALLNDAHSRFMTPAEAVEHFELSRNEVHYGGLGLYTMPLPDGALVLQVIPGSPAARAGVQACDRVTALNGGGYWGDGGEIGSSATLSMARPGSGAYTLTLTREDINQMLEVPGELLPNRSGRIGYVRLDTLWVMDVPDRLRARLAEMEADGPLDGLILDLRPNVGGWRPVLQGILGIFLEGQLGEFSGRLQTDLLVAPREDDPPPTHPDLPLVVLVSERTESYAEVLAATLQEERGAIVLGRPTQGNVETIFPRRLPFGARVWIAEQGFRLPSGETLEGVGVQPDLLDYTDWSRFACARDPQVEMAATLLEGR